MSKKVNYFPYEYHSELKRNRLEVLQESDQTCAECGGVAKVTHHKDGSKTNHSKDNLTPLCHDCHGKAHRQMKTIKWDARLVLVAMAAKGMDKKELAEKIGVTPSCFTFLEKNGTTKNSTMRKIAECLGYPLEVFMTEEYAAIYDELQERYHHINPLRIAIYGRLAEYSNDPAVHKTRRNMLTNELRNRFGVKSYFFIPQDRQEEAITFINNWRFAAKEGQA